MRYTRFKISNFKGVRDIELNLDRPPRSPVFALVGLNESGKTTILEAIHWLNDDSRYDDHELIPKSELANFNGHIFVEAQIAVSDDDQEEIESQLKEGISKFYITEPIKSFTVRRQYTYKNSEKTSSTLYWNLNITGKTTRMKVAKPLDPESYRWQNAIKYIEESMLPPIIYYENFLFDFPDKIYLESKTDSELNRQEKAYRNVIQDVLNSIDRRMKIDSHILERFKSSGSYRKSLESVLLRLASKMTDEIFNMWQELLKINETGGMEITLGQDLHDDDKGYFLEVKVKEGDQNFLIRERILGFRWFFAVILFTHFRAFRYKDEKQALFLLDEPASNLHPTAQTKLLEVFENFPNNQDVIYATHSHHMINPKWLSGTFVIKNEAKEYSKVDITYHSHKTRITAERYFQFVAKYPNDTDYFRPILDALDYQLSKLEFAPELIVVEGKNDYYTLKYLKEQDYVTTTKGDYIYPGTGKDKVDYLVSLYIGWGRIFIVLLDDDSGGRRTYKRLLKDFGDVLKDRIFRLVNIDNNWKGYTLEELFAESDYTKVMRTIYPVDEQYDKSKFNVALQDCFINRRKVNLHSYTVRRFQKLFDFIEEKMKSINN